MLRRLRSARIVGSDPRRCSTPRVDLPNSPSRLDLVRVHLQSAHQQRCRGCGRFHGVPARGRGFHLGAPWHAQLPELPAPQNVRRPGLPGRQRGMFPGAARGDGDRNRDRAGPLSDALDRGAGAGQMRGPRRGRGRSTGRCFRTSAAIRSSSRGTMRAALDGTLPSGNTPGAASNAPATSPMARAHLADMEEFVEAGRTLPGLALSAYEDQDRWDREVYPLLTPLPPLRQFLRTQLRPDRSRNRLLRCQPGTGQTGIEFVEIPERARQKKVRANVTGPFLASPCLPETGGRDVTVRSGSAPPAGNSQLRCPS